MRTRLKNSLTPRERELLREFDNANPDALERDRERFILNKRALHRQLRSKVSERPRDEATDLERFELFEGRAFCGPRSPYFRGCWREEPAAVSLSGIGSTRTRCGLHGEVEGRLHVEEEDEEVYDLSDFDYHPDRFATDDESILAFRRNDHVCLAMEAWLRWLDEEVVDMPLARATGRTVKSPRWQVYPVNADPVGCDEVFERWRTLSQPEVATFRTPIKNIRIIKRRRKPKPCDEGLMANIDLDAVMAEVEADLGRCEGDDFDLSLDEEDFQIF